MKGVYFIHDAGDFLAAYSRSRSRAFCRPFVESRRLNPLTSCIAPCFLYSCRVMNPVRSRGRTFLQKVLTFIHKDIYEKGF